MPSNHLIIKGKVQGVFYRATAKEIAQKMGVVGWIKNRADGNVEALISGEVKELESFIDWCRQGPEKAMVSDVIVSTTADQDFTNFSILRY